MSEGDTSSQFALIEMVFSFGVILAIAVWQLWDVRPSKVEKEESAEQRKSDQQ